MDYVIEKTVFIILNYNSYEMTKKCYNNLKKLDNKINIIIIDNNSTDESKDKLTELEKEKNTIVILSKENRGYAAGNNIGLKYIKNNMKNIDVAFIMNPDIIIDKVEYIYNLYEELKLDEELAVITSITIYNDKLNFPNECCWRFLNKNQVFFNGSLLGKVFCRKIWYNSLELKDNIAYVDVAQGCFFGIKMKAVEKINYFDERTFLYCEEQIIGRKIKKIGMKTGVLVNTFIHHNHYEKDKSMINKKTRIFHLKCLKNSRKIIVEDYLGLNIFQKFLRNIFLDIDFFLKKLLIYIGF